MKKKHLLKRIEELEEIIQQHDHEITYLLNKWIRVDKLEEKCKKQEHDIASLLYRLST